MMGTRDPQLNDQVKALTVTTRTHWMAISIYVLVFVMGVVHFLDLTTHTTMDELIGESQTSAWASWHWPVAVACLGGALSASHSRSPVIGMWVECVGCLGVTVLFGLYSLALASSQGFLQGALTTQLINLAIACGALSTALQILWDQRKIHAANRQGVTATEQVLAEEGSLPHHSGE